MVTRSHTVTGYRLWPGIVASTLILLIAVTTFSMLWLHAPTVSWDLFWRDSYLWHVIHFTFWQALLSALCSLLPAIALARALYHLDFYGKAMLLRLCTLTLALPILVAVFGLIAIYGQQGWLATIFHWLNLEYHFPLYGLSGILLAHTFFNLPLAVRLLLHSLEGIPFEQQQLATLLRMNSWQRLRFVEWPHLKRQLLPVGVLIFILCFASFATVLMLGGGPQATTIELAIYQAISYDFDLDKAAYLSLVQLLCCLSLVLFSQRLKSALPTVFFNSPKQHYPVGSRCSKFIDATLIVLLLLFILPPLLAVILQGLNSSLPNVLQQVLLWQALFTSVKISLFSSLLCLLLTLMLLWSSRELRLRQQPFFAQKIELGGMIILSMPAIVLAVGFFLLLNDTIGLPRSADTVVIITNALMALPFAVKILDYPMYDLAVKYHSLSLSLGMNSWQRFYLVELKALKRPIIQALAFACLISIGDFGIIALFGNSDFFTLPYYLYQQMGSYRSHESAVTALLLLLLCFILFTLFDRVTQHYANSQ